MDHELPRTLPASWYTNQELYGLERRAVFFKSWYLLGPVTRFHEESVEYEVAQIPLIVTSDDEGALKVVNKDTGREVRSHITPTGLLFATISERAPSFEEFFPDLLHLVGRVGFTALPHRRSIKYEGRFNWKTMVDGYQECLHCQYTHPSFSVYYPPTFYSVKNFKNFSQHIADPKKPDDGLFCGMSSFRVCPTDKVGVTRMEFDYYHMESGDKFEEYYKFVRQVALEDYELCEKAQENLEKGVYAEGILNPNKENGVAFYQNRVLNMVFDQHQAEQRTPDQGSKDLELLEQHSLQVC
ncbi:hypothetical protein IWX49DRAFT_644067 [Phyllosticta citricarpa]|uniref:Choline monooxygenase, chloroplastic n=1 Tax=Phyllosticta citricarpa TaxID=55181 RepID=A0ABR1LUS0_9PEZI